KLKEVWLTIYDEDEFCQDFLNTSESSNDNTNIVNAPQEPFIYNQDPDENSSQSPPHIDHHCCYGYGDSLDDIFCHQCTCESCGNGAYYGYNCPLKVPVISNLKPCHNQNVDELPQTLPSFYLTCYSEDENSFAHDSTPNFINDSPNVFNPPPQPLTDSYEFCKNDAHFSQDCPPQVSFIYNPEPTPKVLLLAWDRVSKIKNAFGNKQYKPKDMQELILKLFNDVQNIHEELAEYINTASWNRPAFYNYDDDDDEDYTIAITLEEPVDSLIIEDDHLDTILATESDEVIKSSVEDLVTIPSESEGIPDNTCDVNFHDNSTPLDVSKDQFEEFSDSNDDSTSIDDDYYSIDNIDYVEASPPHYELVSLREVKDFYPKDGKIEDDILQTSSGSTTIHDDNSLPKYDSFLFEIDPDQGQLTSVFVEDILGELHVHMPNVLPTHPNLMLDSDFIPSDNSLPESEIFYFDTKEKNSGSTTIHADISLPDFDHFHFKIEPDLGELTSIVNSRIRENDLSTTNVNLSPEDDQSPLFAYVVWIFFPFLTYLLAPLYLLSSRNKDTIFDPVISIYHSFKLDVSHRGGTFMKFNIYPNHLNESPMEILSSTYSHIDQ
nr:hypothetical protein [Tanacetum cinerariifolium]